MRILLLTLSHLFFIAIGNFCVAQNKLPEQFGSTLNLGPILNYGLNSNANLLYFHVEYEIDLVKNLTIAPFVNFSNITRNNYFNELNSPNKINYYSQPIMPVGIKFTYYLDPIVNLHPKWDLFMGGSTGFAIRKIANKTSGLNSNQSINNGSSGLMFNLHLGTEYHFSKRGGVFLDVSRRTFSLGLAVKI